MAWPMQSLARLPSDQVVMSHTLAQKSLLSEVAEPTDDVWYGLFVFSLVLISIPIKNFAYVLPPLYLMAQLLRYDTSTAVRTLLLLVFAALVSCLSLFFDTMRGQGTNLAGLLVGLVTLLPLFMMAADRFQTLVDDALFRRVSRLVASFVIVQAIIGVGQLLVSGNPDAVTGTLGLLDIHTESITIVQLYFGFLMLSMVLFLLIDFDTWLAKVAIVAGLVAAAVSQSGHQTVFFVAALGIWAVIQSRRIDVLVGTGCLLATLVALVLAFYPTTASNTQQWYEKTLRNPESPKRIAVEGAASILSEPKNLILGAGIGQYSSRAALITSGEHLSRPLPPFLVGQSDYYREHLRPGLDSFNERGEGSAISKPHFSWLTVATEFGIVQLLALIMLAFVSLRRCVRLMNSPCPETARAGLLLCAGATFFLLCCTVENYLEFPQAIFVPYLLVSLAVAWAEWKGNSTTTHLEQGC